MICFGLSAMAAVPNDIAALKAALAVAERRADLAERDRDERVSRR